jgi:endonuclease III related protein
MRPSTRLALPGWRRIPGPPRDAVKARLLRLHVALRRRFGPQRGWPGRSAYEIAVGAILTRNTAWTNAARGVAALRARRLLDPRRLMAVPETALAEVIRPVGAHRLRARRLRAFTAWLLARFGGRFSELRRAPLASVRAELLAVPGLGSEAVDAILLHAAGRPVVVADASTRRVLAHHRLIPAAASYEETRALLEAHLPSDPALFSELHALMVAAGKTLTTIPGDRRSDRRRRGRPARSRARPSSSVDPARRGVPRRARPAPPG